MWYTMNGAPIHTFTDNTTVDALEWADFANDTLVTVVFYANDTVGNIGQAEVTVRRSGPPTNGGTPEELVLGYDLLILLVGMLVISIFSFYKRKKRLG